MSCSIQRCNSVKNSVKMLFGAGDTDGFYSVVGQKIGSDCLVLKPVRVLSSGIFFVVWDFFFVLFCFALGCFCLFIYF